MTTQNNTNSYYYLLNMIPKNDDSLFYSHFLTFDEKTFYMYSDYLAFYRKILNIPWDIRADFDNDWYDAPDYSDYDEFISEYKDYKQYLETMRKRLSLPTEIQINNELFYNHYLTFEKDTFSSYTDYLL